MRHAVRVVFVAMLAVACGARSATPPEIVVDRTACHHCGMLISDRRYAAAERAAATHQGTIVSSLEALLARAGGEQ